MGQEHMFRDLYTVWLARDKTSRITSLPIMKQYDTNSNATAQAIDLMCTTSLHQGY